MKKIKPTVLCDVDGILRDWWGYASDQLEIKLTELGYPIQISKNPIIYDIPALLMFHHVPEHIAELVCEHVNNKEEGTYSRKWARPFDWTRSLYSYLNNNFIVTFVSHQPLLIHKDETREWLKKFVVGTDCKASEINIEFNIKREESISDILIDDNPIQLYKYAATDRPALGIKWRYNKCVKDVPNVYLGDAPNIIEFLDAYLEGYNNTLDERKLLFGTLAKWEAS